METVWHIIKILILIAALIAVIAAAQSFGDGWSLLRDGLSNARSSWVNPFGAMPAGARYAFGALGNGITEALVGFSFFCASVIAVVSAWKLYERFTSV